MNLLILVGACALSIGAPACSDATQAIDTQGAVASAGTGGAAASSGAGGMSGVSSVTSSGAGAGTSVTTSTSATGGAGGMTSSTSSSATTSGAGGSLPTCPCYSQNGAYCATNAEDYATAHACQAGPAAQNAGNVLNCNNGVWTVMDVCPMGCTFNPNGADACTNPDGYHLPWACGVTHACTQGNNQGDHINVQKYAFDFGVPLNTPLLAMRAGKVTVAKQNVNPGDNCYDGCGGAADFNACCNTCINLANWVSVDHGDGTVATYWHMEKVAVAVGMQVKQGDVLGYSGTSGCSTGPHVHLQLMGPPDCPVGYCQSVPLSFIEVGVPTTGENVKSQNACP